MTVNPGPCSSLMYRMRAETTAPATRTTATPETRTTATAAGRPAAGAAAAVAMVTTAGRDKHYPGCT